MSAVELVALTIDDDAAGTARALGARAIPIRDVGGPGELEAAIAGAFAVWLPPFAIADAEMADAIATFRARGTDRARVGWCGARLIAEDVEIRLPATVAVSSPGAVSLRGPDPRPRRGAIREELGATWRMHPPPTLSAHLDAVNRQSGEVARLLHLSGVRPSRRELALRPLLFLARAMLGARSRRNASAPRAVLEAYRRVLVAAKLWERTEGDSDRRGGP